MEEKKFDLLLDVMKFLENKDSQNSGLEDAIIDVLESYQISLTNEQKHFLMKEFVHYERKRRDKKERDRIHASEQRTEAESF